MKEEKKGVFDIKIPEEHCAMCGWYRMIDSGYGYCYRFPPLNTFSIKRILYIFFKIVYRIEYTTVEWCEEVCGEFDKVRESS